MWSKRQKAIEVVGGDISFFVSLLRGIIWTFQCYKWSMSLYFQQNIFVRLCLAGRDVAKHKKEYKY